MYSSAFCKVYNEFGWNYFPEAFGEQLLLWLRQNQLKISKSLDLGCGTGVLCEILQNSGIQAQGIDFSEGMIEVARQRNKDIPYTVANMITYRPSETFDLVTCTGDALNHIMNLKDIEQIFQNVYNCLREDGYFIFDALNEKEVPMEEPIELDFCNTVRAQFLVTHNKEGHVNLQIKVWENNELTIEENITETVHDISVICKLLENTGFHLVQCSHHLLENEGNCSSTWYVIARKQSASFQK